MGRALGNIAGAVAPIVAGYYGGPAGLFGLGTTGSAIAAGALTGAGIAGLRGDDMLMGAVGGGLGGYGGGAMAGANTAAKAAAEQSLGSGTLNAQRAAMAGYTGPTSMMQSAGLGGASGAGVNTIGAGTPVGLSSAPSGALGSGTMPQANLDLSKAGGYQYNANEIAGQGIGRAQDFSSGMMGNLKSTAIPEAQFGKDYGFSDVARELGGGDATKGYMKAGITALPVVAAGLTPEYETFEDVMSEDVYDPNSQLNLNMDTGIREAMQKDSGLRLYGGGGTVSPNRSNPGRLNFGMAKALNNMQVTNNNTGAAVNTAGMTPDEIFKRYYRNKNKFSGPKFEEGGGVIGVSSSPGLPIAGATMGGGMAESVSETMATPGGFDTFESMVASGIDPANAAAMFGMDTDPYLDTGPGMTYTSPPRTSPIRGGISELPPPPSMFTPTPDFDDDYRGGYMTPSRMKSVGMEPGYSGRTRRYERLPMSTGGYLNGGTLKGDGMSDDVPAMIDGTQKAALSQGEFVVPADVVSHLGNGSSDAGSKQLYGMMDKIRKARTGTKKQGKEINPERFMPS